MTRVSIVAAATALTSFAISACSTSTMSEGAGPKQSFGLMAGDGTPRGTVTLHEKGVQATLAAMAAGMPPGPHGLHLHEKGLCDGPAFTSAGGHWNPTARKHGRDNPAGPHLGDLPNLEIAASGQGTATFSVASASEMADADGTALVVHAKADDYRTDPSGNSGDRIACAVIAAPR